VLLLALTQQGSRQPQRVVSMQEDADLALVAAIPRVVLHTVGPRAKHARTAC